MLSFYLMSYYLSKYFDLSDDCYYSGHSDCSAHFDLLTVFYSQYQNTLLLQLPWPPLWLLNSPASTGKDIPWDYHENHAQQCNHNEPGHFSPVPVKLPWYRPADNPIPVCAVALGLCHNSPVISNTCGWLHDFDNGINHFLCQFSDSSVDTHRTVELSKLDGPKNPQQCIRADSQHQDFYKNVIWKL